MTDKRTPNEIGDALEARAEIVLGGERVIQSGGGKFWKLDVKDKGSFIWSCKATTKNYIRITGEWIREARRAARGVIGTGDKFKWGMVLEVDGIAGVFVPLEDFADLVTEEPELSRYLQPEKGRVRNKRAKSNPLDR